MLRCCFLGHEGGARPNKNAGAQTTTSKAQTLPGSPATLDRLWTPPNVAYMDIAPYLPYTHDGDGHANVQENIVALVSSPRAAEPQAPGHKGYAHHHVAAVDGDVAGNDSRTQQKEGDKEPEEKEDIIIDEQAAIQAYLEMAQKQLQRTREWLLGLPDDVPPPPHEHDGSSGYCSSDGCSDGGGGTAAAAGYGSGTAAGYGSSDNDRLGHLDHRLVAMVKANTLASRLRGLAALRRASAAAAAVKAASNQPTAAASSGQGIGFRVMGPFEAAMPSLKADHIPTLSELTGRTPGQPMGMVLANIRAARESLMQQRQQPSGGDDRKLQKSASSSAAAGAVKGAGEALLRHRAVLRPASSMPHPPHYSGRGMDSTLLALLRQNLQPIASSSATRERAGLAHLNDCLPSAATPPPVIAGAPATQVPVAGAPTRSLYPGRADCGGNISSLDRWQPKHGKEDSASAGSAGSEIPADRSTAFRCVDRLTKAAAKAPDVDVQTMAQ